MSIEAHDHSGEREVAKGRIGFPQEGEEWKTDVWKYKQNSIVKVCEYAYIFAWQVVDAQC